MLKKIFFLLCFLVFSCFLYSQDTDTEDKSVDGEQENIQSELIEENNVKPSNFGFYFGPELLLSKTNRPNDPSMAVSTNFGIEYEYSPIKYLSIIPSFDFSIFHYAFLFNSLISKDFNNGRAYICELESRTALTMSFLLDVPVMFTLNVEPWILNFGGGLAFFLRGGFLEPGVKADELNTYNITSKKEVSYINKYFWQNARFLYPSLGFKLEYIFDSGWKTGFKFKSFIPIFNVWDKPKKAFSDSLLFQISIILHPAKV